jgi:HlyD family secretion protein
MKRVFWFLLAAALTATAVHFYRESAKRRAAQAQVMKLSGNIEAHESLVSIKVNGRIADLPIEEGQTLKSGDLVARLDDADYRQQVAIDEATVRVRQRELALGLAGSRWQDIEVGRQAVLDAEADLKQKKEDLARYQALYEKAEISAADLRPGSHRRDARAGATYDRMKQAYSELLEGTRKEELAVDRANVRQAHQGLGQARVLLGYTVLRAPFTGVILVRQAELGEVVAPGVLGQDVTVRTDTYPGKNYHGRISFISSEAEFTPKSVQTEKERVTLVYRVKVDVDNPNFELKPGMPADLYIPLK